VVFGTPAHELFPGVFAEVEKTVIERARLLSGRLRGKPGEPHSRLRRKLAVLHAIATKREQRPPSTHDE
jgi:hypothetical protein